MTQPPSPLAEADPQALEKLLERDPCSLTVEESDEVLTAMVKSHRFRRANLALKDAVAHKKGKWGKGPKRALPEDMDDVWATF